MEAKKETPSFSLKGFPFKIWISNYISRPGNYHWHELTEFIYILEGEAIQRINGIEFKVCPGDLIIMNCLDFHGLYTEIGKKVRMLIIQLPSSFMSLYFNDRNIVRIVKSEYLVKPVDQNQFIIYDYMKQIFTELKELKDGYKYIVTGTIYKLLGEILRSEMFPKQDDSDNEIYIKQVDFFNKIKAVFDYVDKNYSENITLKDMAEIVGTDLYNFCRIFKKATALTFTKYLLHIRLKNAMEFILSTDISITEIAYLTGFSSTSYFIKKFKEVMGKTPLEFRSGKKNS